MVKLSTMLALRRHTQYTRGTARITRRRLNLRAVATRTQLVIFVGIHRAVDRNSFFVNSSWSDLLTRTPIVTTRFNFNNFIFFRTFLLVSMHLLRRSHLQIPLPPISSRSTKSRFQIFIQNLSYEIRQQMHFFSFCRRSLLFCNFSLFSLSS